MKLCFLAAVTLAVSWISYADALFMEYHVTYFATSATINSAQSMQYNWTRVGANTFNLNGMFDPNDAKGNLLRTIKKTADKIQISRFGSSPEGEPFTGDNQIQGNYSLTDNTIKFVAPDGYTIRCGLNIDKKGKHGCFHDNLYDVTLADVTASSGTGSATGDRTDPIRIDMWSVMLYLIYTP